MGVVEDQAPALTEKGQGLQSTPRRLEETDLPDQLGRQEEAEDDAVQV
jgi:hypothetical protein